jgi:hypothetical protein
MMRGRNVLEPIKTTTTGRWPSGEKVHTGKRPNSGVFVVVMTILCFPISNNTLGVLVNEMKLIYVR